MYVNKHRLFSRDDAAAFDSDMKLRYRKNDHVTLYARNKTGWDNLIKIHNDAQARGFYYVPRTDPDFMISHARGVIATTGDVVSGEIPRLLALDSVPWEERLKLAKERYELYKNAFDEFYVELNVTSFAPIAHLNKLVVTFGEWVGAKYVLTCDSHYLRAEDASTHDILLMIRDKKTYADKALTLAKAHLLSSDLPPEQAQADAIQRGHDFLARLELREALQEYEEKTSRFSSAKELSEEEDVWEFDARDLYMKTHKDIVETWQMMKDDVLTDDLLSRALAGTRELIRSVETFDIDTSLKLPKMINTPDDELRRLCYEGLVRLGLNGKKEYEDRLDHELSVIRKTGFADYFLVFRQIVLYCKSNGVDYGPARGSAGGCLISYCLDITRLDPLQFGLLFSRFIDEQRSDPPDIDFDADKRKLELVRAGIGELFGKEYVCAIGSYQMLKTKNVIKDVARTFCLPPSTTNELTKALASSYSDDNDPEDETTIDKLPWEELLRKEPLLQQFFAKYPLLADHCKKLRGQIRNVGKHPAGMIVSSVNLQEWMPLREQDGEVVSCWTEGLELRELQTLGFVKYDILGLRTVSILSDAVKHINQTIREVRWSGGGLTMLVHKNDCVRLQSGEIKKIDDLRAGDVVVECRTPHKLLLDFRWLVSYETDKPGPGGLTARKKPLVVESVLPCNFDLTKIPLDDNRSLHRLNDLDVFGVFQFETPTAVKIIKTIGIDKFEDMYAATSLGRPDPMSGKMHEIYGRRKHGEEKWDNIPILAEYMEQSYGLPLYQESCMFVAKQLAGFSDGETNALRKGLAKGKDSEENMKKLRKMLDEFKTRSQGAVSRGDITQEELDTLINTMQQFGGYSFNRCLTVDTVVEKENGDLISLDEIKVDDVICGLSKTGYVVVTDVIETGKQEVVEIELESGLKIKCTVDHQFLCEDGLVRPLYDIIDNEHLIMKTDNSSSEFISGSPCQKKLMKPQKIVSVKCLGVQPTKNITVNSESHLFYANGGIVTSNSHGVAYALIGYQSLFLKTHYPSQFMCALFNFTDREREDNAGNSVLARYVRYCRSRHIKILPPSVNESQTEFSLTDGGDIRWSLSEIKGLGVSAVELLEKRPFASLEDMLSKVEKRKVNKTKIMALIKSGALDEFGKRDEQLFAYAKTLKLDSKEHEELSSDLMKDETELLGVCLSRRVVPELDPKWMEQYGVMPLEKISEMKKGLFLARVKSTKKRKSKSSGKEMMVVSIRDDMCDTEFFVWQKDIEVCEAVLQPGKLVIVPLKKFDDGDALFYCGPKSVLMMIDE
jgi:DNA polymerase III alpha subunit